MRTAVRTAVAVAGLVAALALPGCTGGPLELLTGDRPVAIRDGDGTALVAGDSVERTLQGPGARRSHLVEVGEGQAVTVAMVAVDDGLDCYLRVYDADGRLVAEDDDGGDGLDSLVELRATAPATFTVEAASYQDDDEGRYRLEVTGVGREGRPAPGQVLLLEEGEVGGASESATRFGFRAGSDEPLLITVEALDSDLDPVVELLGPGGTVVGRDDDGGPGLDSRLEVRTRQGGQHVAVVTDFGADQTGRFRITVSTQRRPGDLGSGPSTPDDRPLD